MYGKGKKDKETSDFVDIYEAFDTNIQLFDTFSLCISSAINDDVFMRCPSYSDLSEAVDKTNEIIMFDKLRNLILPSQAFPFASLFKPYIPMKDPNNNRLNIEILPSFIQSGYSSVKSLYVLQKEMTTYNTHMKPLHILQHEMDDINYELDEYNQVHQTISGRSYDELLQRKKAIQEEMDHKKDSIPNFDELKRNGECIKPLFQMSASVFDHFSKQLQHSKKKLKDPSIQIGFDLSKNDKIINEHLEILEPLLSSKKKEKVDTCVSDGVYERILRNGGIKNATKFMYYIDNIARFSGALQKTSTKQMESMMFIHDEMELL